MSFLSKLFQRQGTPVEVKTIAELWDTCMAYGGKMYACNEYGDLFYIEKVEEVGKEKQS